MGKRSRATGSRARRGMEDGSSDDLRRELDREAEALLASTEQETTGGGVHDDGRGSSGRDPGTSSPCAGQCPQSPAEGHRAWGHPHPRFTTSTRLRVLRRALPARPRQHQGQEWWHLRSGRSLLLVPMEAVPLPPTGLQYTVTVRTSTTMPQPRLSEYRAEMPLLCYDLGVDWTASFWFTWVVLARPLPPASGTKPVRKNVCSVPASGSVFCFFRWEHNACSQVHAESAPAPAGRLLSLLPQRPSAVAAVSSWHEYP